MRRQYSPTTLLMAAAISYVLLSLTACGSPLAVDEGQAAPTAWPSGMPASLPTATILVGQAEEEEAAAADPTVPAPSGTAPETFTPAATPGMNETGKEKDEATPAPTPTTGNTDLLDAPGGSRPPIFVEMVQTSLSPTPSSRMPPADANPTGVFAFNPSDRLLLVQPSVQILPTTEVLVGLTTAKSPSRPYISSELFQLPSSQTTPLGVLAIDADSGALTLAYADQTFELRPGQDRSFKQKGEGELSAVEITTIINHGRPAAIGLLPTGPASP